MEPRALLLLLLLLPAQAQALAQGSLRADRLCGRRLLRALVRVCGGPRWSREGEEPELHSDRELPGPLPDLQPVPQALRRNRREAQAINSAKRCCLTGCTRQDLLNLCPH
ncbi:insulin-like 3 [Octodon degus]|uniref:Insulin-like 3 n=1 Tax=Octodon degus TaxID=10160 RepID=A0A6P3FXI5_OCTDE|nr:insulin-like 3 [Octodon degus]